MNKMITKGNISSDIQYKITKKATVAEFDVAVSRPYAKDKTDFIKVTAFGPKADFVSKWFKKGQAILIEGHFVSESYTDKNNIKRTVWKLIANEIEFAGYPKNDSQHNSDQQHITL